MRFPLAWSIRARAKQLAFKSRAELQGDWKAREALSKMAWENIRRHNRGEEE